MNKILLNGEGYIIKESDLPYLVTYKEGAGGSHFTVTLLADLFNSGSKILFFTAFPMAKDNFLAQIGVNNSKIAFVNSVGDLINNKDAQAIILDSGNEDLFIEVLKNIEDISGRVILVKNIEAFGQKVFDACLEMDNIVLSGNIDKCIAKDQIIKKEYKNIVVFSKPEISIPFEIPELEKWTGYLSGENNKGIIKVQIG